MPPTLDKFFIRGPEIILHALLPIGQLSEKAQEAKRYWEEFSIRLAQKNNDKNT